MNGAPPKKKTSPWVWVGCGCGAGILGLVGFIGMMLVLFSTSVRASEPYRAALARARGDARVADVLGRPVEPRWLVTGSIHLENRDGNCDLTLRLRGSKQNATLHVVGTKTAGRWSYTTMLVTPERGSLIDLLASPGESTSTAPPGG